MKKIFKNKNFRTYFTYGISFFITFLLLLLVLQIPNLYIFFDTVENRTFDLRQSVLAKTRTDKINKDIVILAIDDASYEYLLDRYGEWPIPRDVYADLINYVEKQKPAAIAFDLMFVKSIKSKHNADFALSNAIINNDNVYTSMNFDNQSKDVRLPVKLPDHLNIDLKNDSNIDFSKDLTFSNCRSILPSILNGTKNVGLINVSRADDGILRKMPPFMIYQEKFYPHLSLLVGLKYLENQKGEKINEYYIDKNNRLMLGNRFFPIDNDGGTILNWYGPAGSFTEIPFYKVVKAIEGNSQEKFDFKNKIVYIGTTAVSLYDTKTVPVDKLYPGVEVHATAINNLIDNDFIEKVSLPVNIIISLALAFFVGYIVIRTSSTYVALGTSLLTTIGYVFLTYFVMKYFNLWLAIVLPIAAISLTFLAAYIVKYILKSRDFEHQYKLATTDGLTELYNHRFFQEQMLMQVANCSRYNTVFSLILIDIDFFKKFNDTYGHQSGDAVLRQVAQKLKRNVRSTDFVCRYGGEEMSIILPNTDKDEAIFTAEKICQIVAEKPFKLVNDQESPVTISLGVASYPKDGETPAELIAYADKCLYVAKENGRNQVRS